MVEWLKGYHAAISSFHQSILHRVLPSTLCKDVCNIIRQYHDRNVFDVLHEHLVGIERYEFEMSLHLHGYAFMTEMAAYLASWCAMTLVRSRLFVFYALKHGISLKFQDLIPHRQEAETWRPILLMFWTSTIQMDLPKLHFIYTQKSHDLETLLGDDHCMKMTSDLRHFFSISTI